MQVSSSKIQKRSIFPKMITKPYNYLNFKDYDQTSKPYNFYYTP